jgi:glutaconate CoA-transferase subunit B
MTPSDPGVTADYKPEELLISATAPMLDGLRHVAVGASSPIPAAAAMLTRARSGGGLRVTILGSQTRHALTDGGRELFDLAGQGRIDAFFLGGGQIDGEGNVNLVGIGDYPQMKVRFPGSFGSAYLYYVVPRVILFREEHTARVFVPKVDFVSAAGTNEPHVHRPGGPYALVTGRCVMSFDKEAKRFRLESVHPGESVDGVRENTGFDFDCPETVPKTPLPDAETLALLRGEIADELAATYPAFAERVFGGI